MAQSLRVVGTLPRTLGLIPSIQMSVHNHLALQFQGMQQILLNLRHEHVEYIYMYAKLFIHTKISKYKTLRKCLT